VPRRCVGSLQMQGCRQLTLEPLRCSNHLVGARATITSEEAPKTSCPGAFVGFEALGIRLEQNRWTPIAIFADLAAQSSSRRRAAPKL
jgi:hypothetical protein